MVDWLVHGMGLYHEQAWAIRAWLPSGTIAPAYDGELAADSSLWRVAP
ncbi:MAG: hypothetical protein NZ874_05695 [Fimbriimonadales bacterium]|nr:hypothetical protein [Fimbriimonadales bacterium]